MSYSDDDKPGVSDSSRTEKNPEKSSADKTVFRKSAATNAEKKPLQDDRENIDANVTRLKPSSANNNADATQFRPAKRDNNSTRVANAKAVSPAKATPRPANSQPDDQNTAQHQVLKGRFQLEKVLGVGGMGIVYKAKDRLKVEAKDRDPYVAIKVLSEEFKSHPEAFIALQRESRKSQRIAHPNTVKVYDFDRDGDVVFMTMEYMEGKPLDQLIRQYKSTGLPHDDAWEIVRGLCSALIHAHEEKIVHSDFKPGNVYITNNGMAKIFDFGIARAVANVDRHDGKTIDKTVFDAGNLGALTPAYASLEMLQGKTPDVRDDVYALGCVIYEIFTGEHPFNKIPADEAFKRKLKPKRISGIKKSQWKAIEKSLEFKRSDRIETVEELNKKLFSTGRQYLKVAATVMVLLAAMATMSIYILKQDNSNFSEDEFRNEIEFKVRFDLYKESIEELIANPQFTIDWEENLWSEVSGVAELLPITDDPWLVSTKETIYKMYLDKIRETRRQLQLAHTKILIKNAYRYTDEPELLEKEKLLLAEAVQKLNLNKKKQAEKKQAEHANKRVVKKEQQETRKRTNSFNLALKNVQQQLKCQSRLNMRDFDVAIKKLKSLDATRYRKLEKGIVDSLAGCITRIGKLHPERAADSKKFALRIFRGNATIAAIKITPRDACDTSIAGLGARGNRTQCRDKIKGLGSGPALVVVPKNGKQKAFAVSKYEVSVAEINAFCKASKKCQKLPVSNTSLPATNLSVNTAKEYVRWLSKRTGQKYRLPTRNEWLYAATSQRKSLDPNRNCSLSSRGIQKGGSLIKTTTGKQNSWGLVNYVGNAQEWVYDKGRQLQAAGGSYKHSMEQCDIRTSIAHSGSPDQYTGFRVVRELKRQ